MALVIHGLFFSLGDRWINIFSPPPGPPQPVTISLAVVKHPRADKITPDKKAPTASKPPAAAAPSQPAPPPRQPQTVTAPKPDNPPPPHKPKKSLKRLTRKKPAAEVAQAMPTARPQPAPAPVRSDESAKTATAVSQSKPRPAAAPADTAPAADMPASREAPTPPGQKVASAPATVKIARPLYVKNSVPRYPRRARKKGLEGTVLLEVLVDETGKVKDLKLQRSSGHAILDKAATASVKKWLFAPGTVNGRPEKMWVKVPIRFELN